MDEITNHLDVLEVPYSVAVVHRHAGHMDIVREQLDGFIGLRPSAPNIPALTPEQWEGQRLRMTELADGLRTSSVILGHPPGRQDLRERKGHCSLGFETCLCICE